MYLENRRYWNPYVRLNLPVQCSREKKIIAVLQWKKDQFRVNRIKIIPVLQLKKDHSGFAIDKDHSSFAT